MGEAPGEREDNVHKPFQGKSGKLLDAILDTLGLDRRNLFISNAVHCRPEENATPSNQVTEICSKAYLRREVYHVKPKVIIALGKVACFALTGIKTSLHTNRLQVFKTSKPFREGIPVVVTYHPAAALRNDHLVEKIVEDFEFALKVMKGETVVQEGWTREQVDSIWDIPGIRGAKKISIDLETDGFDPFLEGRDIISVQISVNPNAGYYVRYNQVVAKELRELFDDEDREWSPIYINHNIKFDLKWLVMKAGIKLPAAKKIRCTLIEGHLLDENAQAKDLDTMACDVLGLKPHKDDMKKAAKEHGGWVNIPLEIAVPYGCDDAVKPLRLHSHFVPKLKKQGLSALNRLQSRATRLCTIMEISGFKVDTSRIDEVADEYEILITDTDKRLKKLSPYDQYLNVNAWKDVYEILYDEWNLPAVGKPKYWKDPPTRDTREETLLKLSSLDTIKTRQKEFIKAVIDQRGYKKTLSHYVLGLGDQVRSDDLIHPNFKLFGAVTGRPSCSDPNLQQIPREGPVKELFISRYGDKGVLMQIDVSQAELRLAAHMSGERTMLKYFREGKIDIHTKMAAKIYGIPVEEVTPKQRKRTKTVNFGVLYGSSEFTMAEAMGETPQFARAFIKAWKKEFSDWTPYENRIREEVIENGFVTSIFGRRRRLPILDASSKQGKEAIRQAINSPIQGGVGDYTLLCGCNAYDAIQEEARHRKALENAHFVNVVHDCWVLDTVEENVPYLAEIFRREFREPNFGEFNIDLQVPMDIEIQVGKNWKHMSVLPEAA